jgi:hypothetical protein
MHFLAQFFAGAFLANAIPHLVSGLVGQPFPSPFAKPRGVGDSPAIVNFLWGSFNLLVGLGLLFVVPVRLGPNVGFGVFLLGFLFLGFQMSRHFGAVRSGKDPRRAEH